MADTGKWGHPTTHHPSGIRMRSKLEVDWAKFFDRHRIHWDYEPRRFELWGFGYTPDFWLPDIKVWFEAKGHLDDLDHAKLGRFVEFIPEREILLLGEYPAGWAYSLVRAPLRRNGKIRCSTAVALARCLVCDCWGFINISGRRAWPCRNCGASKVGRSHLELHPHAGRLRLSGLPIPTSPCSDCSSIEGITIPLDARGGPYA